MTPKHPVTFNFPPCSLEVRSLCFSFFRCIWKRFNSSFLQLFSFLCTRSFSSFIDNVSPRHWAELKNKTKQQTNQPLESIYLSRWQRRNFRILFVNFGFLLKCREIDMSIPLCLYRFVQHSLIFPAGRTIISLIDPLGRLVHEKSPDQTVHLFGALLC